MSVLSDCLNNWIGLRGMCDGEDPISGKYINTLPGISLKRVASLSNEDKASYQEVWDDVYVQSLNDLEVSVYEAMQKYFKSNLILDNQMTGRFKTPYNTAAAENYRKGVLLELAGSKYTHIYINHVRLYLSSAVNGAITIHDINTGQLLDTVSFTGTEGVNVIQINKMYFPEGSRKEIFISWDANLTDTIDIVNTGAYFEDGGVYVTKKQAKVLNGSAVIDDNLVKGIKDTGIVVNYNVSCNIQSYICSIKEQITIPLMYKIGEVLMKTNKYSDRLNEFTLNSQDEVDELIKEYSNKYKSSINDVLNTIDKNIDDICFSCNKKRTYVQLIP